MSRANTKKSTAAARSRQQSQRQAYYRKRQIQRGPHAVSPAGRRSAALLILVGVGLGIGALFPDYYATTHVALGATLGQCLQQCIILGAWFIAAALLAVGTQSLIRWGTWLAVGTGFGWLGFNLLSIAELAKEGAHIAGAGIILALIGWLVCEIGMVVALAATGKAHVAGRWVWRPPWVLGAIVLIGSAAAAVAYYFGWEHYYIVSLTEKQHESITVNGPFKNPWELIVAQVVVMAMIAVVPTVACFRRPRWLTSAAVLGVITPYVALAASVFAAVHSTVAPASIGATAADMKKYKIHVTLTVNTWFWIEVAGLAVVLLGLVASLVLGLRWERAQAAAEAEAAAQPPRSAAAARRAEAMAKRAELEARLAAKSGKGKPAPVEDAVNEAPAEAVEPVDQAGDPDEASEPPDDEVGVTEPTR